MQQRTLSPSPWLSLHVFLAYFNLFCYATTLFSALYDVLQLASGEVELTTLLAHEWLTIMVYGASAMTNCPMICMDGMPNYVPFRDWKEGLPRYLEDRLLHPSPSHIRYTTTISSHVFL